MMNSRIRFAASLDHDEDCTFDVTIATGKIETHVTFLGTVDTWLSFAGQLADFPGNAADTVIFTVGGDAYQHELLLAAYCYDAAGHTALRVVADNNQSAPDRCRLEFSIRAEAASINNLGRLLLGWQIETESELVWEAQVS